MLPALPPTVQDELFQLSQLYGQPLERVVDLNAREPFDPISKKDRYGEVCMVVRRPSGLLLTMKKTYYPANGYRLLTGGINHGESVFAALLRETEEETGLQVATRRFLASAAYRLNSDSTQPAFYTFAFLLDELNGKLEALDESERVEAFREITPAELVPMAEQLEHIDAKESAEIGGNWHDWGRFRAVIHRLVWEALQTE